MPLNTVAPAIISYLLDSSTPISGAFNVYDSSTFSNSTCRVLAMEIPLGVFAAPGGPRYCW